MKTASSTQELIRFIGANSSKESMSVEIEIWDNRVVRGFNYKGSKEVDVISITTHRIDSNLLWSHVKSFLKTGESFIVSNGQVLFQWTISNS